MKKRPFSTPEPLEARIAPALTIFHPIPDLVPGIDQTGATLDLGDSVDAAGSFRTHLRLTTNYVDPLQPTVPQIIEIELFDDKAPLTVANFLRYVKGLAPDDFDDVFFHRAIPGFVIQAGGFSTVDPTQHIATDPQVHNEFNAIDAERSNLAGTIAMAKTGLGAHTATSEWFVNLADNSANLDNQNGGFTVFAKVTQGMDVVNAIAALTTYNFSGAADGAEASIGSLNGALSDLPLQNYNPDPDSNPATPAPTPGISQFAAITSAVIIPPTAANAGGATFSLVSIVDATTLATTDLVSGSIAGQTLQLAYKAGASGVAKITVQISKPGETAVFDDFLVTVKPNVIANVIVDPLPSLVIPGDTGAIKIELSNNGAALVKGRYDIVLYLSQFTTADPNGTILNTSEDLPIGSLLNERINLDSGDRAKIKGSVTLPFTTELVQAQNYRILADVRPVADSPVSELFADDNVALDGPSHQFFNAFGTFSTVAGARTNAVLKYLDADGDPVSVKVKGGGFGQFDPNGDDSLLQLFVSGTTADSELIFKTAPDKGRTDLDSLFFNTTIGSAALGNVNLNGDFTASGGIRTLTLGNVGNGLATRAFTIAAFTPAPAQAATLNFGVVRDVALTSAMPIAALTAAAWLDTDASNELILAPAIQKFRITGNSANEGVFQADLTISGATKLDIFKVAGTVTDADIRIVGDAGQVTVGALLDSEFLVGVATVPNSLADFAANPRKIDSFIILDTNAAGKGLVNSQIAASVLRSISVQNLDPASGTGDFGFIADRIANYQAGTKTGSNLDTPREFDRRTNFVVRLV